MPNKKQPPTLQHQTVKFIARQFELVCYGISEAKDIDRMAQNDIFLKADNPFSHLPGPVVDDIMERMKEERSLTRHLLHLFLTSQTRTVSAGYGIGDINRCTKWITERCRSLRKLDMSYVWQIKPKGLEAMVRRLPQLVSVNFQRTLAEDQVCLAIAETCPNIQEINLTACGVTDMGIGALCCREKPVTPANKGRSRGNLTPSSTTVRKIARSDIMRALRTVSMDESPCCQHLSKLIVTDTRVTPRGLSIIIQWLRNINHIEHQAMFKIFEDCDIETKSSELHRYELMSLTSTVPYYLSEESIEAAATLCPKVKNIHLSSAMIDSEGLLKLTLFTNLTQLHLANNDNMDWDFHDAVLPILQCSGGKLENLILCNFHTINITAIGQSCPKLKNLALSGISIYTNVMTYSEDLFKSLTAVEVWGNGDEISSETIRQLLQPPTKVQNVLLKGINCVNDEFIKMIWQANPMTKLQKLTFQELHNITSSSIYLAINMNNDLNHLRVWSCESIDKKLFNIINAEIKDANLDMDLDWCS